MDEFEEMRKRQDEEQYNDLRRYSTEDTVGAMHTVLGEAYCALAVVKIQAKILKERDPQEVEKAVKKFFDVHRATLIGEALEGLMDARELITFRAGPQEPKTPEGRLALALKEERYEDAARIRDEMKG